MKFVVGCDEDNPVIRVVCELLKSSGHAVTVLEAGHWAEKARELSEKVASGEYDRGVLMCWSGTGVSIAANKVERIRAALCWDAETARLARKWNDANILCLSQRWTSETVAKEIVEAFMNTDFDEEDLDQVRKIET